MTVEYSPGYKAAAQAKLDQMQAYMTPHAWSVATALSDHFIEAHDHELAHVCSPSIVVRTSKREIICQQD